MDSQSVKSSSSHQEWNSPRNTPLSCSRVDRSSNPIPIPDLMHPRLPASTWRLTMDFAAPPGPRTPIQPPKSGLRGRILVVDDNVDLAWSYSYLLQIAGYEVGTAFDGTQALEVGRQL